MNLKALINQSVYGTIGHVSSQEDISLLESYIVHNLPILREFKQIVVATNYSSELQDQNTKLWRGYFPNCVLLDSKVNRGHNFGTADLDNLVFDWCKENGEEWLCKGANDVILEVSLLDLQVEEADLYYLNGISYETLALNNFNYSEIYHKYFYPQTNFYIVNVGKCDYLTDKKYLDETYAYSKTITNYNGKIWEYVQGWSCEDFLKQCAIRNNLNTQYILTEEVHERLCQAVERFRIGDPSHKNILIEGVCHLQFPDQTVIHI